MDFAAGFALVCLTGLVSVFLAVSFPLSLPASLPEQITFAHERFTFTAPGTPSEYVAAFRDYYGPTMSAFEAAEKNGRAADLQKELEDLFNSQNGSPHKDATSIPATFLRVTVAL